MAQQSQVIFWAVDAQMDFMLPGGKLYVPGAEKLIPNIRRLVDRARENANPVRPGQLSVRTRVTPGGYSLWAFVPAAALTGP